MRPTLVIVIFLVFLNGSVGLLEAAGVNDALGVEPAFGGADEPLDQARDNATAVPSGQEDDAGTLFGAFQDITGVMSAVARGVYAGPMMFKSLGVPDLLVDFIFAPLIFFVAADTVYYLTGRRG